MGDKNSFIESLNDFRREFGHLVEETHSEVDGEEPFIDDRSEIEQSTGELFDTYEFGQFDGSIFDQPALDRLNSIIPQRDTNAETFEEFFASLDIKHFKAFELLRMGGQNASGPCEGTNRLPEKPLWPNIVPTIRALDLVRVRLGYAINTTSVFRYKDYNECLRQHNSGVARFSQHLVFKAIDFQGVSGTPTDWHDAVLSVKADHPEFGIWTKKYNRFVHIDTRFAT